MKPVLALGCLLLATSISAQTMIKAEGELLGRIGVKDSQGSVLFVSDESGFFSPNGPVVTPTAELLFYPTTSHDHFIRFRNSQFSEVPLLPGWPQFSSTGYLFFSQNGMTSLSSTIPLYRFADGAVDYLDWGEVNPPASGDGVVSFLPNGAILESESENSLFSMEYLGKGFKSRDRHETKSWLATQPGGFSVGEDGRLYRNGIAWSGRRPAEIGGIFVGRLASGHTVWDSGARLYVVNAEQQIEVQVDVPWAHREAPNRGFQNHGIGPWGEVYYLVPPQYIKTGAMGLDHGGGSGEYPLYDFDSTKPAELVVVRNHLKSFGRLNDGGVRLRKDPTTTGEILGTFAAKTGFRILEKGAKQETIGGQKNVWYKVRLLDGREGWFFGSFVQNLYDGPNGKAPPWPNVPDS